VLAAAAFILGAVNVIQVNAPIIARRREDWQYKLVLIASAFAMFLAGIKWDALGGEPQAVAVSVAPGETSIEVVADREGALVAWGGSVAAAPMVRRVDPGTYSLAVRAPRAGYADAQVTVDVKAGEHVTVRALLPMRWGPTGRVFTWLYDHVFAPCNATMFALLAFFVASAAFRAFRARNTEAALLLISAIIILIGRAPMGRSIHPWLPELADWMLTIPNNAGRRAIMMGAAIAAVATGLRVILGLERSHLGAD